MLMSTPPGGSFSTDRGVEAVTASVGFGLCICHRELASPTLIDRIPKNYRGFHEHHVRPAFLELPVVELGF